jgi:hypothetical protein
MPRVYSKICLDWPFTNGAIHGLPINSWTQPINW